ncbi:hypothetical protein L6164_006785 [Bauhinia variegata]|uniref:Uncharacterized protein n=1 Tax=Bauhinia variegata TaxID=167791 RepID=A0ACB9PYA2_BAUVA|nr:hypothetical protein L6164_006785 [Bauhinia variegata]
MEGSLGVRKGAWSKEEDDLLRACIQRYGEGSWNLIPQRAGLNRCRKSCRLRWLNYLKPEIKRGKFAEDEVDMIIRLHKLLGNRWTLIAGRIPGRTANDVKNFWNTYMRKKSEEKEKRKEAMIPHEILKPQPRTLSKISPRLGEKQTGEYHNSAKQCSTEAYAAQPVQFPENWLESLLEELGSCTCEGNGSCCSCTEEETLRLDLWDEELINATGT